MPMLHTKIPSHQLDTAFVIGLFTMFAVTSLLLSILGAKQYHQTVASMDQNYQIRTSSSYLIEKLHQHNTLHGVSITELDGVRALALTSEEKGIPYITYIYAYDGFLRELYVSDSSVFSLEAGQPIMEAADFDMRLLNGQLLYLSFSDASGHTYPLYISLLADTRKETS